MASTSTMTIFGVLASLPPSTIDRLYDNPWVVRSVLEQLDEMAQHIVFRLLFIEQEVPTQLIESWENSESKSKDGAQHSKMAQALNYVCLGRMGREKKYNHFVIDFFVSLPINNFFLYNILSLHKYNSLSTYEFAMRIELCSIHTFKLHCRYLLASFSFMHYKYQLWGGGEMIDLEDSKLFTLQFFTVKL